MVGDKLSHKTGLRNNGKQILFVIVLVSIQLWFSIRWVKINKDSVVSTILLQWEEKAFSAQVRLDHRLAQEVTPSSAVPMKPFLDGSGNHVGPLHQHADGRVFAPFWMEITSRDSSLRFPPWYLVSTSAYSAMVRLHWLQSRSFFWCCAGKRDFSSIDRNWMFFLRLDFSCDRQTLSEFHFPSIFSLRLSRDASVIHLIFMCENDGSAGYIQKGAGTREPRRYDTTIYCVLKTPLLSDGCDLFLTSNGVSLLYDDFG